jgi:hypothetical protein
VGKEAIDRIMEQMAELGRKLDALVADKSFDSKVPLGLREAAEICHVELRWLRDRVTNKEIPAYRHREGTPWTVFPKDVRAYLMAENNVEKPRRRSVLTVARSRSAK